MFYDVKFDAALSSGDKYTYTNAFDNTYLPVMKAKKIICINYEYVNIHMLI